MPTQDEQVAEQREHGGDHHVLEQPDVTDDANGEVTLAGLLW